MNIFVANILEIKVDVYWKLYGYTQEEFNEIMDDDQPYARFLNSQGMKQKLQLSDGEVIDTYINLGANEAPYKVGDKWNLK